MDIAFKILSFGIPFAIEAYKKGKEETKFFEILPGEYNKEIKLAEERKKMEIHLIQVMKNILIY